MYAHTYTNIYPDRQPSHAQAHLVIWTIYSHVNHYFVGMYTSLLSLVTSVIKIQPHILCNIPLCMQTKGNETKSARFQKWHCCLYERGCGSETCPEWRTAPSPCSATGWYSVETQISHSKSCFMKETNSGIKIHVFWIQPIGHDPS